MQDVLYEKSEGIAYLTIDRPKVLNALRAQTYVELASAIRDFAEDRGSKVLVLTGSGRAFCAGQDLNELPGQQGDDDTKLREQLRVTQEISCLLFNCPKVSIAVINGLAIGAGAEIPLACSLRIAANDTYFQFAEIQKGLFQTNGTTWLLPRIVGLGRAMQMLLLGEKIPAQAAFDCGLVNELVEARELRSAVAARVEGLMASPALSRRLILEGLQLGLRGDFDASLNFEIAGNLRLVEAQTGVRA